MHDRFLFKFPTHQGVFYWKIVFDRIYYLDYGQAENSRNQNLSHKEKSIIEPHLCSSMFLYRQTMLRREMARIKLIRSLILIWSTTKAHTHEKMKIEF